MNIKEEKNKSLKLMYLFYENRYYISFNDLFYSFIKKFPQLFIYFIFFLYIDKNAKNY